MTAQTHSLSSKESVSNAIIVLETFAITHLKYYIALHDIVICLVYDENLGITRQKLSKLGQPGCDGYSSSSGILSLLRYIDCGPQQHLRER